MAQAIGDGGLDGRDGLDCSGVHAVRTMRRIHWEGGDARVSTAALNVSLYSGLLFV